MYKKSGVCSCQTPQQPDTMQTMNTISIVIALQVILVEVMADPCAKYGSRWRQLDTAVSANCYFTNGRKKTFSDAEAKCNAASGSADGSLVRIDNEAENEMVFNYIGSTANIWLGLYLNQNTGYWVWTAEPGQQAQYLNWLAGEPNNHSGNNEECAQMVKRQNGYWNDVPCSKQLKFLCEIVCDRLYLGCFVAEVIAGYTIVFLVNKPETCVNACQADGYAFAALSGHVCRCGNSFGRNGAAPLTDCDIPCTNAPNHMCGGPQRNAVYAVGCMGRHLGCFIDDPVNRDLNGTSVAFLLITPADCKSFCSGQEFKFAAMRGEICLCGDSFGLYGSAPPTECDIPCSGDPSVTCGGTLRNDVYVAA
ncbi:hypothetical protein ScPMuIL_004564 [Solemya velum]